MQKKNWNVLAQVLALVTGLTLIFSGCQSQTGSGQTATAAAKKFPSGPISFVVAFSPGGANDICARLIAPALEKELGVPVTVSNVVGGGGWIGYDTVLSADADGQTIGMISSPSIISGYLNPEAGRKNTYRDFAPLVNFANDYQVICCRPDEDRFSTFAELYEYSKSNEMLISGTAGASSDGMAIAKLDSLDGAQFVHLATNGASESLTNLMGKHSDICVIDISETMAPLKSGQIKALAVMSQERVPQNPDIPTVLEEIDVSLINYSGRGIATKAGVPEETLTILRSSLTKVLESKELQDKLAEQGIAVQIADSKAFEAYWETTEVEMKELGPKYFGWKTK